MSNFGKTWGQIQTPVQTRVAVIDPELKPMIGLSAMQLDNLNLRRNGAPPTPQELLLRVQDNAEGLPAPTEYPSIRVVGSAETELSVYNAFGKLAVKGCGVRISRGAADKLGVKEGDQITIL